MRGVLLVPALLMAAAVASAADAALDRLVEAVNGAGAAPATQTSTVAAIARAVSLRVEALRAEQATTELPWGDVFVAHRIAARGGHELAKVFAARKTGAAWKVIAEDVGVDDALLGQDLLAAFPGLAAPRPVAAPPTAPEKKAGAVRRFLDIFTIRPDEQSQAGGTPANDSDAKRREEENRAFMCGDKRR